MPVIGFLFLLLFVLPANAAEPQARSYGNVELSFQSNEGQTDQAVRFLARGNGYGLFLTSDEAVFQFQEPHAVVRMKLIGPSTNTRVEGVDPDGVSNYLIGNRTDGQARVAGSYNKVRYSQVYPGIDLLYYGNQRQLEYDFVISPGADPSKIRLAFEGIDRLVESPAGELILKAGDRDIVQRRPVAFQEVDGIKQEIQASFVVEGKQISFKVGAYDRSLPLVIDPILVYSTYLGGAATGVGDQGNSIVVDAQGNAYITGLTTSANFPTASALQSANAGSQDAFVVKLDATGGRILFATYFGGSGNDEGHSIALDNSGNIVVVGYTVSPNFPIVNGFQRTFGGNQDVFVVKLNNSGNTILYSTYLGGSQDDRAFGVALDSAGSAYVTGFAASRNFPVMGAFQAGHGGGLGDVFVSKLNSAGSLIYSTLLGGIGHEQGYGIAVDTAGSAYVTGYTTSFNFPIARAEQGLIAGGSEDAFLFKLNPTGSALEYSTYFGGSGSDIAVRIAVDPDGNPIIAGTTSSFDLPLFGPYQFGNVGELDMFITKFNADGQSYIFSTYIGGGGSESVAGIVLDSERNIYLTGFTTSLNFPVVNGIKVSTLGDRDAYIIKLAPSGSSIVYSSYIGGSRNEGGLGIALDSVNSVYITGYTTSTDLPTSNALQAEDAGGQDAFVLKFDARDIITSTPFSVVARGATVIETRGANSSAIFGYAAATALNPAIRPTGIAVISLKQGGVLTTEIGVEPPNFVTSGRLSVEVAGENRSVLSLANASDEDAAVVFYYTNAAGESSNVTRTIIPARGHFSRFVNDAPMTVASGIGTLTFNSSAPLAPTASHTVLNERSDLLLTTLPIANLEKPILGPTLIPHFAEGLGWSTDLQLVNNTDEEMVGQVHFTGPGAEDVPGQPLGVQLEDGSDPSPVFEYSIPPRSVKRFRTSGAGSELLSGSISILPYLGYKTPVAFAVLKLVELGTSVTITTIEAQTPGSAFRLLAQSEGEFEAFEVRATRTAIGIANPADVPVSVQLELDDLTGASTGFVGTVSVPAKGQVSAFLNSLPGFEEMPQPFQGILKVTTSAPTGIAVTGLRARRSDRANFIATTTGPIKEQTGLGGLSRTRTPEVVQAGRLFVEVAGANSSVISLKNTSDETATVGFAFNDAAGTNTALESVTIPPRGTFTHFVSDAPLNIADGKTGTLTFESSVPLAVTASHTLLNDRFGFVLIQLPVTNLNQVSSQLPVIPHFVDGGGWASEIVLVNKTEQEQRGEVRVFGSGAGASSGQAATLRITDVGAGAVFGYSIPPRSFQRLVTTGESEGILTGSIRIVPSPGASAPAGFAVLRFIDAGATTTAATVAAQIPSGNIELSAELEGDFNSAQPLSLRTAVVVANPASTPASVTFEILSFSGVSTGRSGTLVIPANGQRAVFLNSIPGLETLAAPFKGILRATTTSPAGISAAAVRGQYDELGHFAVSAPGPLTDPSLNFVVFPHIAEGQGYTTQFFILTNSTEQPVSGVLSFVGEGGQPLALTIQ